MVLTSAALVLMIFREFGIEKGTVLERTDSSSILGRRVESGTSYATILYGVAEPKEAVSAGKTSLF